MLLTAKAYIEVGPEPKTRNGLGLKDVPRRKLGFCGIRKLHLVEGRRFRGLGLEG